MKLGLKDFWHWCWGECWTLKIGLSSFQIHPWRLLALHWVICLWAGASFFARAPQPLFREVVAGLRTDLHNHLEGVIDSTQQIAGLLSGRSPRIVSLPALNQQLKLETARVRAIAHIAADLPLGRPVYGVAITSRFGQRDSIGGWGVSETEMHPGVDLYAPYKTPIVATGSGTVVTAGYHGGYGWHVVLEHSYGIRTLYGHCALLMVQEGQVVTQGQLIAYSGNTGASRGDHLHYEVLIGLTPVDPTPFLDASWPLSN